MYQFKKHVVQEKDNQLVISLYLEIPNVEFADELGKSKDDHKDLEKSARSYVNSKFPNVKNATVKVMAGGMLIASLALGATSLSPTKAAAAETTDEVETAQAGGTDTATTGETGTPKTSDTNAAPAGETGTPTRGDTSTAPAGETGTPTTDDTSTAPAGETGTAPSIANDVSFSDTEGTYFTEPIKVLVDKGVVFGVTDDAFVPYRDVTRAEAAAMLARALNLDTEREAGAPVFNDVNANSDFYGTIAALKEAGVIEGYDDNTFKPNQTITRAELAKMIVSTFDNIDEKPNATLPFKDVGDKSTFKNYIAAIYDAGITQGSTATTFDPYKNTRRAEAAAMIYRSINVELFGQADGRVPIEAISDTTVTVNGQKFTLSNEMKSLLNQKNSDILTDAVVYLSTDKEDTVQKIRYLDITNSGTKETPLVLDGGNTVIYGPLIISGDHISVKGITVKDIKITNKGSVDLGIEGTIDKVELANKETKLSLNEKTIIKELVLPAGSNPNDIIENYDSVKQNIQKVENNANQATESTGNNGNVTNTGEEGTTSDTTGGDQTNTIGDNLNAGSTAAGGDQTNTIGDNLNAGSTAAGGDQTNTTGDNPNAGSTTAGGDQTNTTGDGSNSVTTAANNGSSTDAANAITGEEALTFVQPGEFGVMKFTGVNGYSVGFLLQNGLTTDDIQSVEIRVYKGDTLLATNTSKDILQQYPNTTTLSSPFNINGTFNEDNNWNYGSWNGTVEDIPTKAIITVLTKDDKTYKVENTNLTGNPSDLLPAK